MNNKLLWSLGIAILLASCGNSTQQEDFFIEAYKSDRIAVLEWEGAESEFVEIYSIYIEQGDTRRFPKTKIIETTSTHWESKPRKTFQFGFQSLGVDIRDPSQWGDVAVLTPGEMYTVGIQREFIDGRLERNYTVLLPCEKPTSLTEHDPAELSAIDLDAIPALRSSIFSSRFIQTLGNKSLFDQNGELIEIRQINEDRFFYYLSLDDGNTIRCEKSPNRPELYGDETLINTIWRFQLVALLAVLIYVSYITGKAFHYLNYLAQEENNPREVFKSILSEERSSVFIIYAIVLITRNYFSNKIVRLLVSELVEGNKDLISDIEKIINSHRIYQFAQIKVSILEYLQ